MPNFCLPATEVQAFLRKLKDRTIDPEKLVEMDSEGRRAFFDEHVGKGMGKEINTLFEKRMLLKNQQEAYTQWAKQLAGMRPEVKRDIISRVEKMTEVLSPAEEKAFLTDLAEQKLGVGVSHAEATQIVDLSNKVKDARETMESGGDRIQYGDAVVELNNFINERKQSANRLRLQDFRDRPGISTLKVLAKFPGLTKAVTAALDNSALLRQGLKTMWAHPTIWARNSAKSFSDIYRTLLKDVGPMKGKKAVADMVQADIVSRENALNGFYNKGKLAVGSVEEAFPTTLPERIPLLGRLFAASDVAYTSFLHRTRADVFDLYVKMAQKSGVDLNDTELRNIGRLVNSLTGRGDLGKGERVGDAINVALFSPRFLKSQIDAVTQPLTGGAFISELKSGENTGSSFVRKQAAKNLAKQVIGTATVLGIARALNPSSVTLDPTSADFGKIKIGDTRFDVTGGFATLAVLAARMITGTSTSSTTGETIDLLNPKYGKDDLLDVLENFGENKVSPIGQLFLTLAKGKNRAFEPMFSPRTDPSKQRLPRPIPGAVAKEAAKMVIPLPIQNAYESFKDPNSAPLLATIIADGLGVNTQTYAPKKKAVRGGAPTPAPPVHVKR